MHLPSKSTWEAVDSRNRKRRRRSVSQTEDSLNKNMGDGATTTGIHRTPIRGQVHNKNNEDYFNSSPFGDDSLFNDSLLNDVLNDVESNFAKSSAKLNASVIHNELFEESFSAHEPVNLSVHSTPKRKKILNGSSRKELILENEPKVSSVVVNGGEESRPKVIIGPKPKQTKKKGPKKGNKKRGGFKIAYTNRKNPEYLSESGDLSRQGQELSGLSEEEKLLLASWSLPESVLAKYRFKGVSTLFEWQRDCLANIKVLEGRNLLYSAPTSAGKTLVAEILMLKRVLELGKKAIMILPFVSVAREKMYSLQELFSDAGVRVEGFMGSYNPPGGFKAVDIAICTIEKANSLINRLLTEGNLSQLGTIVVDELHLVGDPHRGYLLELLLTKIKFMSASRKDESARPAESEGSQTPKPALNIQIIGMSATLPNLPVLAKWLDAELVTTDYRPVPLVERLKIGDKIYDPALLEVRSALQNTLEIKLQNDPDHIIYLSLETILNGHSVLIFCPTKAWCEKLAEQIAREFFSIGKPNSEHCPQIGQRLREHLNTERISQVLEQLNQCPGGRDDMLARTASFGVGFHHAGLTYDERDILESAFKRGVLRVIVATSTLSAGVNLPARRVIISSPVFNGQPLDPLTYKQMSGRAGRKGVDTEGESILVCSLQNHNIGVNLIQSALPSVRSALLGQTGSLTSSMKRALLEVVVSGVAKSVEEVRNYTKSTLLSVGSDGQEDLPSSQSDGDIIEDCLEFLVDNEFIKLVQYEDGTREDEYVATQLGSACLASSLSPDEGIIVFKELLTARRCFVLANELHVIYQVTPIYLSDQWRNLDWNHYLKLHEALNPEELRVAQLVGVDERFIMSAVMSTVSWKNPKQKAKLSVHQRFFTALALNDLVNEVPIPQVSDKYGVTKGVVQNLQQAASTFAGMVTTFCGRLGWSNLELLLSQFQERLQFGVQRELCDLVRLSLVNGQRARTLYNAGILTIADLAGCDPAQIEGIFSRAGPFVSNVHSNNPGGSGGTVYVLGKTEALSQSEASRHIVEEARQFLQTELGLKKLEFKGSSRGAELNATQRKVNPPNSDSKICSEPESEASTLVGIQKNPQSFSIEAHLSKLKAQTRANEELMEIENDLMNDTADEDSGAEGKTQEMVSKEQSKSNMSVESDCTSSATASDFELEQNVVKSQDMFEDSDPNIIVSTKENVEGAEDLEEIGPTQNFIVEKIEDDICFMDISFNSFHLSEDAQEQEQRTEKTGNNKNNNNKKNESQQRKNSEPLFASSSSELFEPSDEEEEEEKGRTKEERGVSVSTTVTNKSQEMEESVSSCDLFEEDEDNEPDQFYDSFKTHGRSVKLKVAHSLDALPSALFSHGKPLSLGFQVKETKKKPHAKLGIGGRILGAASPAVRPESSSCQFSLSFYNGGDVVWVVEWSSDSSLLPRDTIAKFEGFLRKMSEYSCPAIMIDSKTKMKTFVKHCGRSILQGFILLDCIWDPKIAEWLCQGEDLDIGEDENTWVSFQKLVDLYLDEEDKQIQDTFWPDEVKECYMSWIFMTQLRGRLESILLWNHFKEIEMASFIPIILMELNGFGFNSLEFERLKNVLKLQAALLELKAFNIVGRCFNFASAKDIHVVLFKDLKLSPPPKTRGTGKEVLLKLDHSVPRIILEWRKVHHSLQLILPFSEAKNPKTGRIHGVYSHFTISGRIIMAEPCIQFIPRDFDIKMSFSRTEIESLRNGLKIFGPKINSLLAAVDQGLRLEDANRSRDKSVLSIENLASVSMRNAFCASSPEHVLVAGDFSQLELRVLALLSKDSTLTQTLNSGLDVFKSIASTWKKIPVNEVSPTLRQESKAIVYAIIYGMGKVSLSEKMGVSQDKAEEYINNFMRAYPGVQKFIKSTKNVCKEKGYVETLLGRRRFLPNISSSESSQRSQAERQAVNYRVQGSASELVKKAMIRSQMRIDLFLKAKYNLPGLDQTSHAPSTTFRGKLIGDGSDPSPCLMVLNLHDELIFEVRKDLLLELVPIIREAMEKPFSVPVKLPVNIKVGSSWGSLTPYENYVNT